MTTTENGKTKKPVPGCVSLGIILRDEMSQLFDVLSLDRTNRLSDFEFTVRCQDGRRCWQIANDTIIFNFLGDEARFEGIYNVGTEFMSNCYLLAVNSTSTEFTIDGNRVTASSPIESISMTATGLVSTEFRSINQPKTVEAQISKECLQFLARFCLSFPDKLFDIDETSDKFPTTTLTIGDNTVRSISKFNHCGYKSMTSTVPAITLGHGSITVSSSLLGKSLSAIGSSRKNSCITISCDLVDGEFLEFKGDSEYVALRRSRVLANTKLE